MPYIATELLHSKFKSTKDGLKLNSEGVTKTVLLIVEKIQPSTFPVFPVLAARIQKPFLTILKYNDKLPQPKLLNKEQCVVKNNERIM